MDKLYNKFSGASALLCALALALVATPSAARERLMKANQPAFRITIPDNARRSQAPTQAPILRGTTTTEDFIIDEDFAYFEEGTNEQPDTAYLLASSVYDPGIYIDTDLTKTPGWWGDWVYSAGGAAALMCPDFYSLGYIATPLGDYSGEVTVTLRAKALPCELTGSSVMVTPYIACSTSSPTTANIDGSSYECDVRLYADQGWTRISYTFKNYSSDPDGSIVISASGYALIDDVVVTIKPTFIAEPTVNELTDLTEDGFTINWNPVRKSFNYWLDLYKKEYTSEGDISFSTDFESGMPAESEGWTFSLTNDPSLSATEGKDDSQGLVLQNGDSFTAPTASSTLKTFRMWARAYNSDENGSIDGYLSIYVLEDGEWTKFGDYDLWYFTGNDTWNSIDLGNEVSGFADAYEGIRFMASNLSDSTYVVVDNLEAVYSPTYEMVEQENPSGEGFLGYFYDTVDRDDTLSYHFSGLDPEGEYYYRIRAHYVSTFSESTLHHAFYVCTPQNPAATDITSTGYTATWDTTPKATAYRVRNFGRTAITEEGWYSLLSEDFSKVDETVTTVTDPYSAEALWNYPAGDLDDYTQTTGWTGLLNTVAQGMLGCYDSSFMTAYITTPAIDMSNSETIRLRIKAYGYYGSGLVVRTNDKSYLLSYQDSGDGTYGVIDGYVDLEITGWTSLNFYDYGLASFMIDEIEVLQYLKEGDMVDTLLETVVVDAPTTSYTFTDLPVDEYTDFAFDVMAKYVLDDETTYSENTDPVWVNVKTNEWGGLQSVNGVAADAVEVARYALDGRALQTPTTGVNIVVYSDGSVVKQIVR